MTNPTPLADEQLAELERLKGATYICGQLRKAEERIDELDRLLNCDNHQAVFTKTALTVTGDELIAHVWDLNRNNKELNDNAALIIAAVNALPHLLAEVKQRRAEIERLRGSLSDLTKAGQTIIEYLDDMPDLDDDVFDDFDRSLTDARQALKEPSDV